ncbi:site-specific DNA-methyltransferase [Cellvibrio mixtus]|uniref:site-specific DNA-methyltransferase n=1 Tax=Cellvibrio mixtus TaxID=39650 RepID=UPI00069348EC|nr:site-specific DNA-methyltransferase [Cellvibrio mixtus]
MSEKRLVKIKELSSLYKDNKIRKLILGENLEVLKLLLPIYEGVVRCVYIDPPYNNGESYLHYDDTTHDQWLSNIVDRLKILRQFLSDDGSIWISIDDGEMHYLKVAADAVFGRNNFVTTIVWQQRTTRENRKAFSNNHEYLLVYAKSKKQFTASANKLLAGENLLTRYKNPDNDLRGHWQSVSLNVQAGHAVKSQFYEIVSPTGKKHSPPNGRCWAYNKSKVQALIKDGRIWFGKNGSGVPRLKKYLSESAIEVTPETLWMGSDVGTNKEAKKHLLKLFPDANVFDTPKPERLLQRIFDIATNPDDLILDAYVGSGASISVAHKMSRQYIGIDKGHHLIDYVLKRQLFVLAGEDLGILARKSKKSEGIEVFKLV